MEGGRAWGKREEDAGRERVYRGRRRGGRALQTESGVLGYRNAHLMHITRSGDVEDALDVERVVVRRHMSEFDNFSVRVRVDEMASLCGEHMRR